MDDLKVLVVDDEKGMREGVARVLSSFALRMPEIENGDVRFRVQCAATRAEAEEQLRAFRPDLLLLDYKLPDATGLDILQWLTTQPLDVLTIMITAYASLDVAVAATKRGAYDFLAKPFTPEELRGVLGKGAKHLLLQRETRRLAEEKKRVRFQFISVLAHELKSPLSAVEGYLQVLRDKSVVNDPAACDRMLDRSLVRLQGMRKLILDLLDLTAIESGEKRRELSDLDLAAAASAAIENAAEEAAARGVTVTLACEESVRVRADRGDMDVILNNLVSNAIKYNRPGGRVTVTLDRDGAQARIRVSDTGIGLSVEDTPRLFHDFGRIKNEKTRDILGSGLGLSTVKKLAQVYGGDVAVESQPDVGSTFTVRLAGFSARERTP